MTSTHPTHEVTNQPPPLDGFDPLACDPALADAVTRYGVPVAALTELAREAGSGPAREHGRLAELHHPVLHTHDRYGHRADEVEFHPSWHWLMTRALAHGLHAAPWDPDAAPGAHVAQAAGFYLWTQVEAGHGCPLSMTYAAVPALRHAPELAAVWEPGLRSRRYDPVLRPPQDKHGLLAGMSMTEKQGGSDIRANTTTATPSGDGAHRLVGHKWFTSAPMNDVFLTLAQAPGGLTCFAVPRVLPDGARNGVHLQRLKNKLGNRANASAEIEYDGALGRPVGAEGRGVPTIIEMVSMTRLDCVLGSAATMRAALSEAAHHVAHRTAFGTRLADTPLMSAVVADLALECEAATVLGMRLAAAIDAGQATVRPAGRSSGRTAGRPDGRPAGAGAAGVGAAGVGAAEGALLRLALPAAKYYVCKRAPTVVAEALECLGGNGYVEESGLPRLYREAPLNSLWEGSGNVTALDVLRALSHGDAPVQALLAELDPVAGAHPGLDRAVGLLRTELSEPAPQRARRIAELITLCLQAALLLRYAPDVVSAAFLDSRFGADGAGRALGVLPVGTDTRALVERITPHPA